VESRKKIWKLVNNSSRMQGNYKASRFHKLHPLQQFKIKTRIEALDFVALAKADGMGEVVRMYEKRKLKVRSSLAVAEENALDHVLEQRRRPEHPANATKAPIRLCSIGAHLSELSRSPLLGFRQTQHSRNLGL